MKKDSQGTKKAEEDLKRKARADRFFLVYFVFKKRVKFLTGFIFHSGLGFLLKLITLRKRLRRKLGLLALGKILKLILLKMINAKLGRLGT